MIHSEFLVAKPARANGYARSISKAPSAKEWEEFEHGGSGDNFTRLLPCSSGHFWARNLHETRYKLHSQGVIPRVLLNGLGIPKALQYKNCTIHKRQDCTDVCDVLAQLYNEHFGCSLVYRGESLAAFTAMAFDDMCKPPKRLTLQTEARDTIMARNGGRCVICGGVAQEIDHSIPRGAFGQDDLENMAAICRACHKQKTSIDHQRLGIEDLNVYMSPFSDEIWAGFVESRKPTQFVCDLHKAQPNLQDVEVDEELPSICPGRGQWP